ncbi:MAG: hypothetical protein ACR2IP_04990 [Solirubrobacteraceae bacterium]
MIAPAVFSALLVPIFYQGTSLAPFPEVTPAIVGHTAFVSTVRSYACAWPSDGKQIACSGDPVTAPDPLVLWRRSYAGVYAAERVDGHLLTFIHGENKNELVAGVAHVNTVNGDRSCYSGVTPVGYRDCWPDYYGFVSAARDGHDQGPIVWPAHGYLTRDGHHASQGVRHPSSFTAGGYVYVFYLDSSLGGGSIVEARSPAGALADPRTFQTLTAHGWRRSLPADGLDLRASGPPARPILRAGRTSFYFAVTKAPTGYIGLEYGALTPSAVGTTIWISPDLQHWHRPPGPPLWTSVGTDLASAYDASTVRYPRPFSSHAALSATGAGQVRWMAWP